MKVDICLDMFMLPFVFYNNKGSGCLKKININRHNKVQSKKSVGYVIKSNG